MKKLLLSLVAILCGFVHAVKADTYWLRGPDSSKGTVRSLDKFANDTTMVNGFNASMGWALDNSDTPTLPGDRVTSGSMSGHRFIIHMFDANGDFVQPPDYFPASGVNGEPNVESGKEQSVLQDRWPNRESEGYEKQGYVPKRFVARTPSTANATFPGEYLELRYGIIMHKCANNVYTINDLRVTGWGVFVAGDSNNTASNSTTRFNGGYTVYPGAKFKLAIDSDNSSNSRNLCVLAAGHGSGLLVLGGDNNFKTAQTLYMNGALSDFTGPVHLVGHSNTTIQFAYDNSFPADPTFPLDDGLLITNGVIAKFTGNVTIGPNRKVQFFANSDGVAPTIYVENGKTVRIESEFAGTCGLNKTGGGTLVFAHPAFEEPITFTGAQTIPAEALAGYIAKIEEWNSKYPALSGGTVSPEANLANVSVSVDRVGVGSDSAEVSVIWGVSADALVNTNVLDAAAVSGQVCNGTINGLTPSTTYYYAFTVTNGLGLVVTTPPTSFETFAANVLTLENATAVPQKKAVEVGVTVSLLGAGATSADVYFAYGLSADALGEPVLVKSGVGLNETVTMQIPELTPGTTYYYAFSAENNASPSESVNLTGSFETLPLDPPSITEVTVSGAARRADITLTLGVGDDVDSAFLMVAYGTSAAALNKTNVIDAAAAPGDINYTIKNLADNTTYYCAFTATNAFGKSVTTANYSFKTPSVSSIHRLWVGGGAAQADGSLRWDDPLNWADGIVPKDGDAVHFPDNTTATIEMPAWAFASNSGNAEFAISNDCDIVLVKSSEVEEDLQYRFNGKVTLPESSSLTLSGCHVWFSNGTASNYKFEGGLTVTDGAYFQLQAGLVISNNQIVVEKKSKFGLTNGSPTLAGDAKFILDDSELLSEGGNRTVTFKNNAKLVFRGKSPQASIIVTGGKDSTFDSHLVFCIPAGGYERIPLLNLGTSPVPNTEWLYCTVDRDSPAFSSPMNKVVPLISTSRSVGYWKNKDTMRLDELGECSAETMREWVYMTTQLTDENLTTGNYDSRDIWTSAMVKDDIPGDNLVKTLGVYIQGPVSYPVFNLPTIVPDIHTAAVEVTLRTLGVGATSANVYIACGTDVNDLGEYKLVKEGADLSDVIQTSIDGLDYDTDYYYVLLATNDLDPAQFGATTNRFTTLPAEVMAISNPTATPGKGISDFSVMVDKLGEGASSVEITLIWGTDKANLDKTNLVASAATLGEVDYRLCELPRSAIQYFYAFVATNGLGQVASTITNGFKTVSGSVDCLWSGEGEQQADGSYRWDDYRNWASGAAPIAGDKVCFPDGAEVTIEMPAAAFASGGEFAVGNNCKIVLKKSSEIDADLEYKFSGKVTLPATSTLTLSGCHVWFSSTTLSNYQFDGLLTVTDGAYFQLSAGLVLTDNRIVVEKKSKFGLPQNGITLAGATEIVIDDSEFLSENGSRTVLFKDTATLVFKGKAPYAYIFVKGDGANYTPHLLFNIPQGGYDRIPLVNSIAAEMPNAAVVYCAIDSQSPAFSQDIDKVVPLIVSSSSVAYSSKKSNMLLDEIVAPAGAEAAWVYRTDVLSDADVAAGTYDARDAWSDAVPQESVVSAIRTLGVYLKCDTGFPMFNAPEVTPDVESASVNISLKSVGTDAESAAVYFAYGTDPEALGDYTQVADVAVADEVLTVPLTELTPKTIYYYSFIATNNLENVGSYTGSFKTLRDPSDTVYDWGGAASGDWDDPESWADGIVPPIGSIVHVIGNATITRGNETASITDARITINDDGSLTLVSGSVMPHPTLDLTQPVAGQPLTVEAGTFGGISGGAFTVEWKKGTSMATKSYPSQPSSTETSITPTTEDYEFFFQCTVKDSDGVQLWQKDVFFSKLPVLYMTTDDGQTPTKNKEEHTGYIFVQGNEQWASPYDGTMVIKMRGNTTINDTFRKKPWKLKLGSKAKMFGIAKSKHWVLLANDKEKSAMRNKLAYDLANEIGSLGMESTWVQCFLNGEYQGLYQFAEHLRIASDRVDIFDWEGAGEDAADAIAAANVFTDEDTAALEELMATNLAWVTSGTVTFKNAQYDVPEDFRNLDISGGYLVESSRDDSEVTKFADFKLGTLWLESMVNSPEFLKTNPEMLNACWTRIENYFRSLASPDGYTNGVHWSELADTDAMATYLLTIELMGNDDAEKKSRYFYWDVGGLLKFGPVWDFDWGVGNTLIGGDDLNNPESWRAHNYHERSFYREWTDDPWFCTRLRTLYWTKARDVLARIVSEGGEIDQYHYYLAGAAAADEVRWPIKSDKGSARTFEQDVDNLRTFLTTRLAWLDRQFADVPTLMESFKNSCYYTGPVDSSGAKKDRPSNSPYTADTEGLPIRFDNAMSGSITVGTALEMSANVADATVATVDVFVNGLKVGETLTPESRSVACVIPAAALTEMPTNDNCVALVARNGSGEVVSRNYRLVHTVSAGMVDGYTFYFNGDYTGDQIIAPTGTECVVIFDEANIAGKLVLPDGVKAYLCPTNGTENTVAGIVGESAHLTLKDFDGLGGKVSLEGADTLISISNLVVKSGTLDLTSTGVTKTQTPVVNVLGHVKQDGGEINLDLSAVSDDPAMQAYGIYVANKDPKDADGEKMKIIYAEFNGGTFNATVGGWKSAALYIKKGSAEATFNDGCTNVVTLVGPEARFVNASGDLNLKGGEFAVTMPEPFTSITNARVFKSDKEIKIKGGHYIVNAPGPGSEIFSVSKNDDGDDSIITITAGTFELVADDDCFNADDRIDIQGGLFHAVSLNNDVFDSNGDMIISGGTIMAYATAAGHEAFDVDPAVQGTEVSAFLPHQLTISGGTIFATGGENSAWPENLIRDGVTLLTIEDRDMSAYSDKYLTLTGVVANTTAKLPTFPDGKGSILATCLGLSAETTSDSAPTEGSQNFHDLYIVPNSDIDQTGLRFYEIYGSTNDGVGGDTGEYIVLTNVSDEAINLAGMTINIEKLGDYKKSGIGASKCCFMLTDGILDAGESIRLDQADWTNRGWTKITNGDLHIEIFDALGDTVQVGETSFSLYPEADGKGAALVAKRFDNDTPLTATKNDWESSVKYPIFDKPEIDPGTRTAAVEVAMLTIGLRATSAEVYVAYGTELENLESDFVKTVTAADLSEPIRTTLTDLEPDTEYYCVLSATNDLDPAQFGAVTNTFHTKAIEKMEISGASATDGKPGAVDLSLSVDNFGEDASSVGVSIIYGTDQNNLNHTNDFGSVTTLGPGNYLLGGLERTKTTYYYAFVVTNGLGQVLSTTTNSFETGSGTVNCLWVGKGDPDEDDGSYRWDDWRNWECGVVPAVKPKNQQSGCDDVYFPDNTQVTIEMPMKTGNTGEYFGNKFVISNNCDIVLNNPREATQRLEYSFNKDDTNADNTLVLPESSSLTLSGCMMYVTCKAQSTFYGDFTVTDGGYLKLQGANIFSNSCITVEKGSKFGFENNTSGCDTVFAGKTEFILDDSELAAVTAGKKIVLKDEATLELRGKAPYAHFVFDGAGDDSTPHLIFNIPDGGYDRVPLVNESGNTMPANQMIYFTIDRGSAALKSGMDKVVTLISRGDNGSAKVDLDQGKLGLEGIEAPRGVEAVWVWRDDRVTPQDVTNGTYAARTGWTDAVPQSTATKTVTTLGVYINGASVNPVFNDPVVTTGIRDASIDVSLFDLGKEASSAKVYFACGTDPDDLGAYELVTDAAAVDAILNVERSGLTPETPYYYAFIASNDLKKAGSVVGSFTTLSNKPTLEDPKAEAILQTVRLGVTLASVGEASEGVSAESAEVKVMWGESEDKLTNVVVLADAAKAGDFCSVTLKGLPDEMTIYYAFTADNGTEEVTTDAQSFVTPKWNDVGGPYDYYPTEPGVVPEGFGVTFVASDVTTPYHVIPLADCHYAVTSSVTKAGQEYWFYSEADFEANASAMIGEKYYLFLSDAVDAAKGGDTVEQIRDNNFVAKQMEIDMPLVIHGNGHTVKVPRPYVDASGYVNSNECTKTVKTIFLVKNGSDVEITDMTVMGGGNAASKSNSAKESAVVVTSGGVLKLEGVTLTRSNGALVIEKDTCVLLDGCQLVRNGRYCGAGIFNRGNLVMVNTSVSENRTTFAGNGGGGAIENQGKIYVSNCVICNNSSGEYGGAINNYSGELDIAFYMINTTISGNFTTRGQYSGGGIALRAKADGKRAEFYSVNNIICNNYFYDTAKSKFVESDIYVFASTNAYENDIEYCVYGKLMNDSKVTPEQLKLINNVVTNSDVFLDSYESKRVYAWTSDTAIAIDGARLFSDPYQPLARYAPIRQDGAAVMGNEGVTTYFNYDGWKTGDVKMSYMTLEGEMTALGNIEPATEADLVTTFYETKIVPGTIDREIGIVGASAWADEDQSYTLRLIEEPVNGEVENITLYGDTYRGGTEVTVLALPDYTCEFLGWYDADDNLVSPDAAYTLVMIRDTELKAKFTGPTEPHMFMNIDCEQVEGTHGKFPITITTNWLARAFHDICPDGVVTDGNVKALEDALNAPDEANGLNHVWQNYVLGQLLPGDPNGRIWLRAEQTRDPSTLNFRMQELAMTRGCGFKVRYRLNTKAVGEDGFVRGEYAEEGEFADEVTSADLSHRVIDLIFIPTNAQTSAEFMTTVNTAGVLKVDSPKKIEILAAPWSGFSPTNNPAVKATDYVKASSLSTNDILYVYDQANSNYLAWAVQADGTWRTIRTFQIENGKVVSERGADASRTNAIPRGAGVWLERQDVTKPIYLYGQVDPSSVATPLAKGWNLVGNPFCESFDVSQLTPLDAGKDHLIIPTGAEPLNCTYADGKWSYTTNAVKTITLPGGKTITGSQSVRTTEGMTLRPGLGFWYVSGGESEGDLKWKEGE